MNVIIFSIAILLLALPNFQPHSGNHLNTSTSITYSYQESEGLTDSERYILRLRNDAGERVESAWASLEVTNIERDEIRPDPPDFYEFQMEGNGIFVAEIKPFRLIDRQFTLRIDAEGHRPFLLRLRQLNDDITVILEKI